MSPQLRKKWIAQQMDTAKQNFLDGINFDYESVIGEVETDVRDAYTALVRETNEAFKKGDALFSGWYLLNILSIQLHFFFVITNLRFYNNKSGCNYLMSFHILPVSWQKK